MYRRPTLSKPNREALFKCICGILKSKNCRLYRVGGIEDHLHVVCSIPPTVAVADLVKDIKLGATSYIKETGLFPSLSAWQRGYGTFTYAPEALPNLIAYGINQENHQRERSSLVEMMATEEVEYDPKYLD